MAVAGDGNRAALRDALWHAREVGLIGRDVDLQIAHAEAMADWIQALIGEPTQWLDLGAGGGLPSLVLLARWPAATAVLVDARERSARELERAVSTMAVDARATVICGRAEDVARLPEHRERYSLVVARAFGPPAVTAECAAGLVAEHGDVVVSEPPDGSGERWPAETLAAMGLDVRERSATKGRSFVCLHKVGPCPERLPRRAGVPLKRPLW